MNILICDDEALAVDRLSRLVEKLGHTVVATAAHGQQLLEKTKQYQPDVILLDIQMPDMDGLTAAKILNQMQPMPAIVFCTAYEEHALTAFQLQATGYLLKPIMLSELQKVLDHVTKLTQAQLNTLQIDAIAQSNTKQRRQITAKTHRGIELIAVENIYYFLADQKYITIRHKMGQVLVDETLKELEQEFAHQFIRIHRNALISLDYLDGLELIGMGQYQVRFKGIEDRLVVSRRHLSALRERVQQL